jgi:hypothetical protein
MFYKRLYTVITAALLHLFVNYPAGILFFLQTKNTVIFQQKMSISQKKMSISQEKMSISQEKMSISQEKMSISQE